MKHYKFDSATVRLAGGKVAREFLGPFFTELNHELLLVALCDEHLRLRQLLTLRGALSEVAIRPVDIMRQAVRFECAGFILAHNHPSGAAEPSQADKCVTRRLALAADAMHIMFLDHLIFAGDETFSFREMGLL